jgi:hypothetical protein
MMVFEILNPIIQTCASIVARSNDFIEKDNNIFGIGTFMEESSCALVVGELFLFRRLFLLHVLIPSLMANS